MAKKLILLLLIIPVVVMIILFAASDAVANMVDVHVEKVEIVGGAPTRVYLDFDESDSYTFEYVVTPTGAKNKNVSIRTEQIGEEPLAEFIFDMQPGKITLTPTKVGSARVIVYADDDSTRKVTFDVHVTSIKLQDIDASISKDVLTLGGEAGEDTAQITTTFLPANPSNTILYYKSSDESVVTVSAAGVVRAVGRGAATITVTSAANENIKDTIDVVVEIEGTMVAPDPKPTTKGEGTTTISFDYPEEITKENLSYRILDENGEPILNPNSVITGTFEMVDAGSGQKATFAYKFVDADFVGSVTIEFILEIGNHEDTCSCKVSKVDKIDIDFDENIVGVSAANKEGFPLYFELTPSDAEFTYDDVIISNTDLVEVVSVDVNNGVLQLKTKGKAGIVTVSLTIRNAIDPGNDYVTLTKTIEIGFSSIEVDYDKVAISKADDSLENLLTVGGYVCIDINGDGYPDKLDSSAITLIADIQEKEMIAGYDYTKNFKWHSSKPDKVKIDEKTGVISYTDAAADAEEVEFWISYVYGDQEVTSKSRLALRCVKDGINVYNYPQLHYATKADGHPIVLQKDVDEDFGKINGAYVLENKDLKMYEKIDTTYDYTYYENIGEVGEGRPQVITLLQFRENLYGNGHIISANNVTYEDPNTGEKMLGDGGNRKPVAGALFQGPLNFVELVVSEVNKASVKAQDNICFAIYDNVNITDVELRGCNLKDENGQLNLVDLNWVGTTVEVLGTNVNITYSRLTNGRTVLRAFGDDENPEQEIELTVSNCILSQAREFIMRIGSNRFVDANKNFDDIEKFVSPTLPFELGKDKNGNEMDYNVDRLPFTPATAYSNEVKQKYSSFSSEAKKVYDDSFINTYVTVRDCAFRDTGIFAIGMDSHFAGKMLHDGAATAEKVAPKYKQQLADWHDLAKTSYGAKLTLEGQIWLYNWKPVKDVDSTTLIDVVVPNIGSGDQNEDIAGLVLDIKEMIAAVKGTDEKPGKYPQITTSYNDEQYVHAGIAFFGGGKNYSVLEIAQGTSGMLDSLATHEISLAEANVGLLSVAAGPQSFYFYICSGKTVENGGFSPAVQDSIEDKFGFVERKTNTTN